LEVPWRSRISWTRAGGEGRIERTAPPGSDDGRKEQIAAGGCTTVELRALKQHSWSLHMFVNLHLH
jgi:hypothetical protein